jgi:hypothetical protein
VSVLCSCLVTKHSSTNQVEIQGFSSAVVNMLAFSALSLSLFSPLQRAFSSHSYKHGALSIRQQWAFLLLIVSVNMPNGNTFPHPVCGNTERVQSHMTFWSLCCRHTNDINPNTLNPPQERAHAPLRGRSPGRVRAGSNPGKIGEGREEMAHGEGRLRVEDVQHWVRSGMGEQRFWGPAEGGPEVLGRSFCRKGWC